MVKGRPFINTVHMVLCRENIVPVWSVWGSVGGAEVIDRPDRSRSSPVGTEEGTAGGGLTADSCTWSRWRENPQIKLVSSRASA